MNKGVYPAGIHEGDSTQVDYGVVGVLGAQQGMTQVVDRGKVHVPPDENADVIVPADDGYVQVGAQRNCPRVVVAQSVPVRRLNLA
jgi:hypothetical protein